MSILIKGMKMPNTWRDCIFSNGAAQCKLDNMELCGLCFRQRCPLIPIPPHGRLIDADRLLSEQMKRMYYHLANGDIAIPIVDIEKAPTIIEASGEET